MPQPTAPPHTPVNDNKKENWRILTYKEIYAWVKKPVVTDN
jgi:hypothetical protein